MVVSFAEKITQMLDDLAGTLCLFLDTFQYFDQSWLRCWQ